MISLTASSVLPLAATTAAWSSPIPPRKPRGVRYPLGAGVREGGEVVLLLRPTAKALIPLLKADDKQASLN
jgi:hypothetical protein